MQFIGADFSYGVGKDNDEAEMRLKRHKAERKASGHLERGELRGIRKKQNPKDVLGNLVRKNPGHRWAAPGQ
ncbi:MAG: hypothetical protein DMG46_23570 [Acidobacteria bacterium]|nr:MAG: hypothetical protein DMG46_23570 [Acidobacteriota bacterium]